MAIGKGKDGQLRISAESTMGTVTGSYHCMRVEALPNFPASRKLIENHIGGHQHPQTVEKPEGINLLVESAFSAEMRIRRAAENGGTPDLVTILKSAGWNAAVSSGATTLSGTPTVSELVQASNVTGAGQFILVERSAGVFVPVLVSSLSTATVVPHVRLAAAPATGAAVQVMHTLTPTNSAGYSVSDSATLSFLLNTRGMYDDSAGDLTIGMKGCACASIGEISFGLVGTVPKISATFHGLPVAAAAEDIAADSFVDSDHFLIMTSDAEFSIGTAAAAGDIVLARGAIVEAKVNLGFTCVPVYNAGSTNIGGASGYMLMPGNPTISIVAQFNKDAWSKSALTDLEGTNASKCIQLIQPTRDLDHPAFAVCMPNCHLKPGSEPSIDVGQDIVQLSATYVASTAGIDSDALVSEVGSSPIFIGVSGEAA